jgi:molecular chaperone HscB
MSSEFTTKTVQICRTCGGGAPVDVHFCPQCTKILTLGRQGDYFSYLGVPRRLNLDITDLEQKFRALSRNFHPDYFYNATPTERRASLERSSYLNDAYRTLRQPIARIGYLLELEGLGTTTPDHASNEVPPALLEEVFALNEELDSVRELRNAGAPADEWRGRLERARTPIEAKREEHETHLRELSARWDALLDADADDTERRAVLGDLRERMLERNYINNLLAAIDREAADSGLQAPGSGPELTPGAET